MIQIVLENVMCSDNHSLDIFDKYIIQGEPEKQERAANWKIAIGLQDVDGLRRCLHKA